MVFLGNHDNLGMELMRGHRGLVLTLVSTGLYLACRDSVPEKRTDQRRPESPL